MREDLGLHSFQSLEHTYTAYERRLVFVLNSLLSLIWSRS